MALTSHMVPLGTPAPDFSLPDLDDALHSRADYANGAGLLVIFSCNHCPYVKHVESALGALLAEYADRLPAVAICTNDAEAYPDDAPAKLRDQQARAKWAFPYLLDSTQEVGRAFNAACTPDFFLYDGALELAYRGAMDDSTPGNGKPVTGEHLRNAIEHVLKGEPVPEPHHPAMGCGIKWRQG